MKKYYACLACEAIGESQVYIPGSWVLEALLWMCFLVPGLIYSLCRSSSRKHVCCSCQSQNIVPVNSPRGLEILQRRRDKARKA